MSFLKAFVNFTRSKIPLAELILIFLSVFAVKMEFKYDILIVIAITFIIKDMDNEIYEILVILPNRIKDIIMIRYLTIYLSILIGYIIGIFLFQENINSYFYSLSLVFIYINIIIPLLYTKGMKITKDPLSYAVVCFIGFVFFIISYSLNLSILKFFNDIVGFVLVIGTLIVSYKLSFLRIYGKRTREEKSEMDIRKVIKIMSIELVQGWLANIFLTLSYILLFAIRWIQVKDAEYNISDITILFAYMFGLIIIVHLRWNIFRSNTIDKEVEQIILILPVKKDERILGRLINSGLIEYMMIIPYIIIYASTPSVTQFIGVRGGLSLFFVYVAVLLSIRNISKYNIKYSIPSIILSIVSIIILSLHFLANWVDSFEELLMCFYSSEVSMIIGNTYVGIILGIVTLVFFYYFNFTYVLKGIKNNRWQIR